MVPQYFAALFAEVDEIVFKERNADYRIEGTKLIGRLYQTQQAG
jgi:hypothetical protein